ncbi:MAG: efflux RND transporter permease subunit [Victivallales bacterium]|nr:efflux RND transporter permease subunit [Victivallales bacterium]
MFLADASTKRPVAMTCLLIALTFLGLNSYRKISVENLPKIDIPYITIQTVWAGATPADIEKDVGKKIEDAVSGLDGIKHITTTCVENLCIILLEFSLSTDVDVAAVDVREKIDAILQDLPSGCERPVIEKIDVNATSVVTLCLAGDATIEEMYDYVDNSLADKFSTVPGVGKVEIIGGNEREVHVELDREALAAAGLTSADVVRALQQNVLSLPAGRVKDNGRELSVKYDAEYATVEEIGGLEVANSNGVRRYIRDLGTVRMTTEEVRERAFIDGVPCIIMNVIKKAEGNTVKVVNMVRKRVEKIQGQLPGGMKLVWFADSGAHVQNSVDSTLSDIMFGVLLCAAILLIFLANIRTTLIVSISMPLTIVISLFFMWLIGYSLNTSTLLALGLSIGILVSNSIVVLENVVKRFDDTPNAWDAARLGTNEVGIAVLASAGTNVIVMIPIAMMSSMVGLFFTPFAVTTLIVNLVSIFISFTLTPILCALFLKPTMGKKKGGMARLGEWWNQRVMGLGKRYVAILRFVGASRLAILLVLFGCVLLLVHAFSFAGKLGFTMIETADRGKIFVKIEFPTDYDLEKTTARLLKIQDRLKGYSDLKHILAGSGKVNAIGGSSTQAVYLAQIQMAFQDKTKRSWTIFDRVDEITQLLSDETDCIITVAVESEMGGIQSPLEMNIVGEDLDVLDRVGTDVVAMVKTLPDAGSVDSTVRDGKPQILIAPKRAVLSDLKMPAASLGNIMRGNLEGIESAIYKSGDRSYDIRVKFYEKPGQQQVREFMLPGTAGRPILLESLADVEHHLIPVQIKRLDKVRTVTVTGTLSLNGKLGLLLNDVRRNLAEKEMLPPGYEVNWGGDSEMLEEAIADFLEAAILAIVLTYLTLSAILESYIRPFMIMFTLPLGLVGVLWALRLTEHGISIFVLLGCVMLIGVVVNAAVLIIDRLGQLTAQGLSRREAMFQSMVDTFRAVLMVILASGIGMLPMALGRGIGSELRAGIGIASTGGVVVSGLLSIIIIPLMYVLFTKKDPKKA